MSNILWYVCLASISVGIAVYAIYRKRDNYKFSTFMVFYLFAAGITWVGEFIVLGLFNAYAYKTGVYQNPWAQNLLGHLLLNTSMFPAAATVVAAYSLKYGGIAFIAAIFVIIEYVFSRLELYEQHWWTYYLSFINAIAFMLIARKWFHKMNKERYGMTRAITYFFVALICIHTALPILLLLGKQHFQLSLVNNLFGDFYLSSIIVSFLYHLVFCFILVYFVCVLKKWYWKIGPFIISLIFIIILEKMNILVIDYGWKLIYYLLIQQISIAVFVLIEKYTLRMD